ncbi:unnamed protein product, partial [marine sediment metagenome]
MKKYAEVADGLIINILVYDDNADTGNNLVD